MDAQRERTPVGGIGHPEDGVLAMLDERHRRVGRDAEPRQRSARRRLQAGNGIVRVVHRRIRRREAGRPAQLSSIGTLRPLAGFGGAGIVTSRTPSLNVAFALAGSIPSGNGTWRKKLP